MPHQETKSLTRPFNKKMMHSLSSPGARVPDCFVWIPEDKNNIRFLTSNVGNGQH